MLKFYVNQEEHFVADGSPHLDSSLLNYLRHHGITGFKRACG